MDRHELNIKVEQLKKLVREGDYKTAAEIADAIDWRKVQSSNLLSIVSDVYENIGEYTEAKTILLMAYEKSSMGKRMLYRLTELAIKEGSIDEAYKYYEEFERVATDDNRVYLLRYKMLTARNADINQRIHALETYNSRELDEKYQYKLAELYYEAGRYEDSVRICDNIMLMFGLGHYVEKAIELKTTKLGMELTEYQNSLIVNREHYAEKLREVELEYSGEYDTIYEENYEKMEESAAALAEIDEEIAVHMRALESGISEEVNAVTEDEIEEEVSSETMQDEIHLREEVSEEVQTEESIQDDVSEEPAPADTEVSPVSTRVEEAFAENDEALENSEEADFEEMFEEIDENGNNLYLILASKDVSKALQEGMGRIRAWNDANEEKKAGIKTNAEKLNARGLLAVKEKVQKKVLVVENAGDLNAQNLGDLIDWVQTEDISFVLLDTPLQISNLIRKHKKLEEYFEVEFLDKAIPKQVPVEEVHMETEGEVEQGVKTEAKSETVATIGDVQVGRTEAIEISEVQEKVLQVQKKTAVQTGQKSVEEEYSEAFLTEKIDVETFVQYASEYAQKIDCSISGKSLLALYERAEIMEADGEVLSRESAKELIEEVADIAENPPVSSRIKAMLTFDKKYDKNDRLILKEEYFIS